ncbi:MAG: FtsX-like permease family protein [Thermoplasmata archaeon]|nr:FtsX-like permease family protein [Thermoplasmata archaeon]
MADAFVLALLLIVAVAGVATAAMAATHRLSLRIAVRNVRRGRWRTVLLVLGLLVGTTIVSSSLVIGDTVNAVNVHFTYQSIGFTTEAIYDQSLNRGYLGFNYSVFTALSARTAGDSQIAGITPEIVGSAAAYDRATGVPQSGLNLIGVNGNQSRALGPFVADDGTHRAGPGPSEVYLDDQAANDVGARVGDPVILYGATSAAVIVAAIVHDDTRGGAFFGGNAFVDLPTAQHLENLSGELNFLAVTNAGSLTETVGLTGPVSATLNASLVAVGAPTGLAVHQLLRDNLAIAETAGSGLSTLFLVLGLFSIVAGGMLIVGIFVMLAEERKGEMGMLRAIGLKRRELVLIFYFEGFLYSAGSALAGTALGVGVGYGLVYAFSIFFASSQVSSAAILASFTVSSTSLVVAYVVGFLLTLATVAIASGRASRLNIVRAIRNVPEPAPQLRVYTLLAYLGGALLLVGGVLLARTYSGSSDLTEPLVAGGLIILGASLVAARFVRNRAVFTAAGVSLLLWTGVPDLHDLLLGTGHAGTIFAFFVEGVWMVLGAILVYIFNSELVVAGVTLLMGSRPAAVSVARVGLSYPSRRPFRTAINLAIFSMVVFTIVGVACFGSSIQANLDHLVQAESGGYTFFGVSQSPIPDLPRLIANNSTLRPLFGVVVPLTFGSAELNFSGLAQPYQDNLFSAPTGAAAPENFYATNGYNFSSSQDGWTASQVWSELASHPEYAVVDGRYSPNGFANFGGSHPSLSVGDLVVVNDSDTHAARSVTVIGILSESTVNGIWVNPGTAASLGYHHERAFLLTTTPGTDPTLAAQRAKIAFFAEGLLLFDFASILKTSIQSTEAIVSLLEVYVTLGLAVGIAAIGIVALRAVVERRGEIGMLRAEGFTQPMILRVFLLEYSYVALLGIGIGTGLAIVLTFNAAHHSGGFLSFSVPVANVATIVAAAYALTIAAVIGPSIKAARLPPAEAVRYSE